MTRALRTFRSLTALSLVALAAVACGGFSTEEAEARCEQEREAYGSGGCFTELTFDACVEAYEECGDDSIVAETCPLTYSCPE